MLPMLYLIKFETICLLKNHTAILRVSPLAHRSLAPEANFSPAMQFSSL